MAQTTNINMYADVASVLDAAIANGGAIYEPDPFGSEEAAKKAAIRFRFRAYYYRTLLVKAQAASLPEGAVTRTPYDNITVNVRGRTVVIELLKATGRLTSLDGSPIYNFEPPVEQPSVDDDDPLLQAAKELIKRLPT